MASIDQNLQPFTCNGDVSKWVKNSRVGPKTPNKQTNMYRFLYLYPVVVTYLYLVYPVAVICLYRSLWRVFIYSLSLCLSLWRVFIWRTLSWWHSCCVRVYIATLSLWRACICRYDVFVFHASVSFDVLFCICYLFLCIGAPPPHVILNIYKVYPYTKYYSPPCNFKHL